MTETIHQLDLENGTPRLDPETERVLAGLATVPAAWGTAALEAALRRRGRHVAWVNDIRARSAEADETLAEAIATAIHGTGSDVNDEAFLDDVVNFMREARDWHDLVRLTPTVPEIPAAVASAALDAAQADIQAVTRGATFTRLSYVDERAHWRSLSPETRDRTDPPQITANEASLIPAIDAITAEAAGWGDLANEWIQRIRHITDPVSALGGAAGIVKVGRELLTKAAALNDRIVAANEERQRLGLGFVFEGSSGHDVAPRAVARVDL